MAFALVLATLWAVFFVLSSLGPIPRPQIAPPASPEGDPGDGIVDALGDRGTSSSVAFAVLAVLLGGALAYGWLARRTGPTPEEAGAAADDVGVEVAQLSAAVEAAGDELARHADPRQAVLAAYAAMARHLATGLVHRGRISRTSDTATELLDRAVDAGLVTGAPARTLTDLFREARFSRHPMGEEARQAAEESLAQVRAELRVRRG